MQVSNSYLQFIGGAHKQMLFEFVEGMPMLMPRLSSIFLSVLAPLVSVLIAWTIQSLFPVSLDVIFIYLLFTGEIPIGFLSSCTDDFWKVQSVVCLRVERYINPNNSALISFLFISDSST